MGQIIYTRGTTYYLTHKYTAPTYLGATLLFVVKTLENDSDATDLTNAVMAPKRVTMTGSTFPQTTTIKILPADVAVTILPSDNYWYSIKVIDSNGDEYIVDSGNFTLNAETANETS
jgi:hypothetical protein